MKTAILHHADRSGERSAKWEVPMAKRPRTVSGLAAAVSGPGVPEVMVMDRSAPIRNPDPFRDRDVAAAGGIPTICSPRDPSSGRIASCEA